MNSSLERGQFASDKSMYCDNMEGSKNVAACFEEFILVCIREDLQYLTCNDLLVNNIRYHQPCKHKLSSCVYKCSFPVNAILC